MVVLPRLRERPILGLVLPNLGTIHCEECHRGVNESTATKERWGFWSDGCGKLLPYWPECSRREFAPDAPSSGSVPFVYRVPES